MVKPGKDRREGENAPSLGGYTLSGEGVEVMPLDHALDDLASVNELLHQRTDLLTGSPIQRGEEGAQVRDGVGHTLDHGVADLLRKLGVLTLGLGGLIGLGGVPLGDRITQGGQLLDFLGSQVDGVLDDLVQDRNISGVSTHSVHFLSRGRSRPFI